MESKGFFFGMWQELTFGQYLQFLVNFVARNYQIIGLLLFAYALVIFIGRYGGSKYIPERFEGFIMEKSGNLIKNEPSISTDKMVRLIYNDWKSEITSFPSYVFVRSKKDYWIEKPSVEVLEDRLGINKEKVTEILINNGVIVNDVQ